MNEKLERLRRLREEQAVKAKLEGLAALVRGESAPRHPHDVRHATFELAQHGRPTDASVLAIRLCDPDPAVRGSTELGLLVASSANRGGPEFWAAIIPSLTDLLSRAGSGATGTTAELLLHADRRLAVGFLTDVDGIFRLDHPNAWAACVALCQRGIAVPCGPVIRLHDECSARLNDAESDTALALFAYALELLAWAKCDAAEHLISAAGKSSNPDVRQAAAWALHVLRYGRRHESQRIDTSSLLPW